MESTPDVKIRNKDITVFVKEKELVEGGGGGREGRHWGQIVKRNKYLQNRTFIIFVTIQRFLYIIKNKTLCNTLQ